MGLNPVEYPKCGAVEFKGSVFTLPVLHLHSVDLRVVVEGLARHLAKGLRFFEGAPVVLDLGAVRGQALDLVALNEHLRAQDLVPVGVRSADPEQQAQAREAGLAVLQGGARIEREEAPRREPDSLPLAKVVEQPVRSGQQVYARGGDLVLLAPVNPGAEVIADGSIHVYAPLRGRALAGVRGDTAARIFALSMEAELVSVAGHFRIFEEAPPGSVHRRPAQIYLDGERLVVRALDPWKDPAHSI